MEKFEYIFIDNDIFDKSGFDTSEFKNINKIRSFYVVGKNIKSYVYTKENFDYFNPFSIHTIKIPKGKRMVVGYYELND